MMHRETQPHVETRSGVLPPDTAVRSPRHDPSAMVLAAYLRALASDGSRALAGYNTVRTP